MSGESMDVVRRDALRLAYRMLGSAAAAEDIVQEAWLRRAKVDEVRSERAWWRTVVTRLCVDELRSAKRRRESYPGIWLPEPVRTERPTDVVELAESLSMAFLVVMEQLSPLERAAYLLREVFDVSYEAVAAALEREPAACRQLVARARKHLDRGRPRFDPDPAAHEALLAEFGAACATGDVEAFGRLLADEVRVTSDGGEHVRAARRVIVGRDRTVRLLVARAAWWIDRAVEPEAGWFNGQPGIALWVDGRLVALMMVRIHQGQIVEIHGQLNPDKLIAAGGAATWLGEAPTRPGTFGEQVVGDGQ